MSESLKTAISEVLCFLLESDGLYEYDFHAKYGLSPCLIEDSISYLLNLSVIKYDEVNGLFKINEDAGVEEIKILREKLNNRRFKIKDEFGLKKEVQLSINKPYIPDENLLDISLKIN